MSHVVYMFFVCWFIAHRREMAGNIVGKFKNLFSKKDMKIIMIGLDAAGRTVILYKLKIGEVVVTIPTIGKNRMQAANIVDYIGCVCV